MSLLFLFGCAVVPSQDKETPAPTENLTPTEPAAEHPAPSGAVVLEEPALYENDYALLWSELETSYPYLPYLRGKGKDIDGIRERYAERIKGAKDPTAFKECLFDMFFELDRTAHLSVIDEAVDFQNLYSLFVLDPELSVLPDYKRFREILTDPRLADMYAPPETQKDAQEVSIKRFPAVDVIYVQDVKALVLQIRSFSRFLIGRDWETIREALAKYPEAEHIIFDISRNSGGATMYWVQNLAAPFGEDTALRWREYFRSTPLNREYGYDENSSRPVAELSDAPEWAISMGLDRYREIEYSIRELAPDNFGTIQSDAKRWVLVSKYVYSASEQFTCFCKATGWATVVGEQTGGDGLGEDPILFLLPDSGLLLEFSNTAGENPDGRMNIEGTTPDILLPSYSVSVNDLVEMIRYHKIH